MSNRRFKFLLDQLDYYSADITKDPERLVSQIIEVFPDLEESKTPPQTFITLILTHWSNATIIRSTMKIVKKIIKILYPNLSSRLGVFYKLREFIKLKFTHDTALIKTTSKLFDLDNEERKTLIRENENALESRLNNPLEISELKIKRLAFELISTKSVTKNIWLCALSIGSRLVEILKTSTFEKSKEANIIRVCGLAKNKTGSNKCVERPLLFIAPDDFLQRIAWIREQIADKNDSSNYARQLSLLTKRLLGDEFHFHDLRRIYASLAYKYYGKGMLQNIFIKHILGHENVNTSLHYVNINLNENKEEKIPEDHLADTIELEGKVFHRLDSRKLGKEAQLKRILEKANELHQAGIKVTNRNLRKLGAGSEYAAEAILRLKELGFDKGK